MTRFFLIAALASCVACSGHHNASAQEIDDRLIAENAAVKYIRNVNIPSTVDGKLIQMNIDEGMSVNEGDVLAVIDDTSAKLARELKRAEEMEAMFNADNDVNKRAAIQERRLADTEVRSYEELFEQGAVPFLELEKKKLAAGTAELRIELAEMNAKIAKTQYIAKRSEREIADFELQRRQITAPFDGFVETRIAQQGEWVQPGSPIATLVQLDRVRVEGDVSALKFGNRIRAGTPVRVRVFITNDQNEAITVAGKIGFVSSELDLRKRYRTWVDIDNQKDEHGAWLIKPGMQAEIIYE